MTRTRMAAVLVLLLTFAAGAMTGAATLHVVADTPEPAPQSRRESMFERLQLTPEQQEQVTAIMQRRRTQMEAFWEEHGPAMRAVYDSTRMEIRAVLTPEQQALEDQWRADRRRHFDRR